MNLRASLILFSLCTGLCAQEANSPPNAAELERELNAYRQLLLDWGGLTQYGSENTELRPDQNRVVFLGDEITEAWGKGDRPFFPGKPYLNRGISRQTVAQMLVRFRQDVIDLKPKVVVIEAGTNDIGRVMGPSPEGSMVEHFMSMVELAKVHGIHVVLASVTPVCDCFAQMTSRRPPGRIRGLNAWLKTYAKESGSVYLDYYSALANGRLMRKEFTVDGFLPNDAGYAVMEPLAERAIKEALENR
jgi:lysophospholipase L1-like esterase